MQMSLVLRISLAGFLAYLAILTFTRQAATGSYIRTRYGSLRYLLLNNFLQLAPPEKLFTDLGKPFFIIVTAILVIGSALTLLNRKLPILLYGYLILVIGGILHIPIENQTMVSQIRRLIFVFAIFFCMVSLATSELEDKPKKKESESE